MKNFRQIAKESLEIFGLSFVLNLVWENLQAPLFIGFESYKQHFWLCFQATFFDAFFVTMMYWLILIFRRGQFNLSRSLTKGEVSLVVILGLLVAIYIEQRALIQGKWAYLEIMPTIGGWGVFPLIQLFTTTLISLWILRKIVRSNYLT